MRPTWPGRRPTRLWDDSGLPRELRTRDTMAPPYSPNYEIVHSRETQSDGTGLTRLIHVALPVPGTQRRDQGSRSARPPSMLELHQKRAQDARGCGKATKSGSDVLTLRCPQPAVLWAREGHMSGILINVIIQIVAAALGGNAVGAGSKDLSLGTAGNTIAGAIGGSVGGQILALLPILSNAAGSVDVGTLLGQAVGGGVAGAIVTAVVGLIKNKMA